MWILLFETILTIVEAAVVLQLAQGFRRGSLTRPDSRAVAG